MIHDKVHMIYDEVHMIHDEVHMIHDEVHMIHDVSGFCRVKTMHYVKQSDGCGFIALV